MFHKTHRLFAIFFACASMVNCCCAQITTDLPASAIGIDVEDRVGEFLPLEARFVTESGDAVALAKYFNRGRPVVLTLNYSDCPGLCIAQLQNLVATLQDLNGAGIGEEFDIVSISIDPTETPQKATRTKEKYASLLRGTKAKEGWHFLTGTQKEITKVAKAVGFQYTYDKANQRYNHPAVTYFISSEGRICRYLLSLGVEPQQFSLALQEARRGKLADSITDAIIQFCYLYDSNANRYSASARRIMAFGGLAFVMLVTGCTAPFWFSRRKPSDVKPTEDDSPQPGEAAAEKHVSVE